MKRLICKLFGCRFDHISYVKYKRDDETKTNFAQIELICGTCGYAQKIELVQGDAI